ncbi:MAG: molybdopterin converting factor subunit 1 [gamma proteobacterium symbiont of Bathyaustriella thionipta]|nr:molybdopterin converting factor subunit 1 [gamma proteobacterium symbiont of Bathyaustriella thionipta]MCU7949173.1 molybdopterin converting factor subunit 1 [gamma proteobacterium symbiont of Bathyaustriella thionipta]MCU7954793.1 molybdopterin converting factor subunit 1 [gamma proteobacterium symbiont of Bathyaustriella thionipta]MCU7956704.1 molybdopterin converting factor subunit 1 [gamma proteobacterium symbiont of Bathyaustriella thionipta]MCU7966136.1 molybdopterin converting factor 
MGIEVKFFASMRDIIGEDREIDSEILNEKSIKNVDDIWNYCAEGKERPANVLIAVNMDYVDAQTLVKEGDEVAFFPPVTGG